MSEKEAKAALDGDIKKLLSMPEFHGFIRLVLKYCGIYITPLGETERETFYKVGKQDVGNWILKQLASVAPDKVNIMMAFLSEGQKNA